MPPPAGPSLSGGWRDGRVADRPEGHQVVLAFLAFLGPAKAASLSDGLALNRTAAPAATPTFSPVRG